MSTYMPELPLDPPEPSFSAQVIEAQLDRRCAEKAAEEVSQIADEFCDFIGENYDTSELAAFIALVHDFDIEMYDRADAIVKRYVEQRAQNERLRDRVLEAMTEEQREDDAC